MFSWASGSYHNISVLEIQGNGSVRYLFLNWSDGGTRTHQININTSDITLTAYYRIQFFLNVSSPFGLTVGSGWYDNGTSTYASLHAGIIDFGNGTRLHFQCWSENAAGTDYNKSAPILMDSPKSAVAVWKTQYEVSLSFKMWNGRNQLTPRQCQIMGATPNNTLITLSSFSHIWLDCVRWSIIQVLWQGNNIVPPNPLGYIPTASGKWFVNCNVYDVSFREAFKASDGSNLHVAPALFTLMFPNGTLSPPLMVNETHTLQNGTYELSSVSWQGTDITPVQNSFTVTAPYTRSFDCKIYEVNFIDSFRDSKGRSLLFGASGFSLLCPNGSNTVMLPLGSYYLQHGTFELQHIAWKGFEVCPPFNRRFNSSQGDPKVNCTIFDLAVIVKTIIGLAVPEAQVNLVYVANSTTIATAITDFNGKATLGQLPFGSYRAEVPSLKLASAIFTITDGKVIEITAIYHFSTVIILFSVIAVMGTIVLYIKYRSQRFN
jgi:hypothetical protein